MKLLFVQEAVYLKYQNELYSARIKYETYWNRFLHHFDSVTIFARVEEVNELPSGYDRSTGPRVDFIKVDYYNGPLGFFKKRKQIKETFNQTIPHYTAFVLRIPGPIGALASKELRKRKLKYVTEVVGDPFEVADALPLALPLKIGYKYWSFTEMRKIVANASAVLYVTEKVLQKRYSSGVNAFHSFASNVIIPDHILLADSNNRKNRIASLSHRLKAGKDPIRIGVVGMLYAVKSPLEIVRAAKILIGWGLNIQISFAGEGPLMQAILDLASDLKIADRVICLGTLSSGNDIFNFLDSVDLYLQFSKTEGLPRAMAEAMARGCPVIGSKVGGIPELLPDDLLVPPGDFKKLAKKINWLLNNPDRMQRAVEENLVTAVKYLDSKLKEKRLAFYSKVYEMYKINRNINK